MSEENEDNPWPGFVDIVSSALLVFVFLVLIQLMVIAGVSMKVGQNAVQEIAANNPQPEDTPNIEESVQSQQEIPEKANAQRPPDYESKARIITAENSLVIVYDKFETLLSEENSALLDAWINDNKEQLQQGQISLNSFLNQQTLSVTTSSYISYTRMMELRGQFIKNGLLPKNISIRIKKTSVESNHVEIHITP